MSILKSRTITAKKKLPVLGQPLLVDNPNEVVCNEVFIVTCNASAYGEAILDRRQWTDDSGRQFCIDRPCQRHQMKWHQPAPPPRQYATGNDEYDKCKMHGDSQICQSAIHNMNTCRGLTGIRSQLAAYQSRDFHWLGSA